MTDIPTTIDENAPVISRRRSVIAAPRAAVWQAHIDVARWPEWQRDMRRVTVDEPVAPGGSFTWETAGIDGAITSTIYAVEPMRRTLWGGPAMGIVGMHEWLFEDAEGGTLVQTNESWAGPPIEADPKGMQTALDGSLDAWLDHLANHMKARHDRPARGSEGD